MNKINLIIVILIGIISLPFLYLTFTPKRNESIVLPGLVMPELVATSTLSATTSLYINQDYGFSLDLPTNWQGYTLATSSIDKGVQITIRNAAWSTTSPLADIPVLVYPIAQWTKWQKTNFEGYKTAAPIGPSERGRNEKYVFATAPRYNFSFLPGFEEVATILQSLKGINAQN